MSFEDGATAVATSNVKENKVVQVDDDEEDAKAAAAERRIAVELPPKAMAKGAIRDDEAGGRVKSPRDETRKEKKLRKKQDKKEKKDKKKEEKAMEKKKKK